MVASGISRAWVTSGLTNIYTTQLTYTDPTTGISAPYYVVCQGCVRPSGLATIAVTTPNYQTYNGVDFTVTKRFSNRWQAASALTWQNNPQYYPGDSASFINPTGASFQNGFFNTTFHGQLGPRPVQGQRELRLPLGHHGRGQLQPPRRPDQTDDHQRSRFGLRWCHHGRDAHRRSPAGTLAFQNVGQTRLPATSLLDLSAQKTFKFNGGKQSVKAMLDCFNVLNANTPFKQLRARSSTPTSATT